ncbi:MAG: DUF2752 domain-containing protein [Salibacteraceae bacterium]|nr:DUF2752 domain-containing protein [Salibacteraceae bacterium]|tara:strand:+ start:23377 stop:23694 length:318 start_codon:yes stop_codon:yes gene_type:complete
MLKTFREYIFFRKSLLLIGITALFLFALNLTGQLNMLPACFVEHYTGFHCIACGSTTASIDIFKVGFDIANKDHFKPIFAALSLSVLLAIDIYSFTKGKLKNSTP